MIIYWVFIPGTVHRLLAVSQVSSIWQVAVPHEQMAVAWTASVQTKKCYIVNLNYHSNSHHADMYDYILGVYTWYCT